MVDVQKLRDQRANIWEQAKSLLDAGLNTAEERESYDRMEADLDQRDEDIERAERASSREQNYSRVDRPGVLFREADRDQDGEAKEISAAFGNFVRNGIAEMETDQRNIMRARFMTDPAIKNAAGVGSGSAGGYAVPAEWWNRIVEVQTAASPMLQEAEVITTATGANLPWPTNDDTGNIGAILAENTAVTEQDITFGTAALDSYMYTSKMIRASLQFLQDSSTSEEWLQGKLGTRVGRILNSHFTVGTGTSQPDGIVTSATVGVTGTGSFASTKGISGDDIIDLTESLGDGYDGAPGLKFMMHKTVRKAIRKLKGTDGQYLWQPALSADVPSTIASYPFVINNDMPTLAASSKSLLFGDIKAAYVIRIVKGLQMLRLTERYADYLQVGFLGFERADGTLQDAQAVRVFQTTATA